MQETSRSIWSTLRANVLTLFNGILLVCFPVLLAIGRWQDALFGFSAIENAVIGTVQEYRAKLALDRLALLNAPNARRCTSRPWPRSPSRGAAGARDPS